MTIRTFDIIKQHFSEADLRTFYVGFDFENFKYDEITNLLMDSLVDFAFGYHTGILREYDKEKLKEAAKSIYKIKTYTDVKWTYVDNDSELSDEELKAQNKFLNRGEFGELILHLLLRDFIGTIPLLSKIYFKDADGATIHGFDLVHIGPNLLEKGKESLYFGESKLYSRKDGTAGEKGINDLVEDIKCHFKKDFLYREFALIHKKKISFIHPDECFDEETIEEYKSFLENKKYWFGIIENAIKEKLKLKDFLDSVTVPLVCTYQSNLFKKHNNVDSPEFIKDYEKEMKSLQNVFIEKLKSIEFENDEPIKTDLNIVLMLFPIPSKKELVKKLHQNLYIKQNA